MTTDDPIRLHILDERGRAKTKRGYQKPGSAVAAALKASANGRRAEIYTDALRSAPTLVFRKGAAYLPVSLGGATVDDPTAHLRDLTATRNHKETPMQTATKTQTRRDTTASAKQAIASRITADPADEYAAAYTAYRLGERPYQPIVSRYEGVTKEHAGHIRERIRNTVPDGRPKAAPKKRKATKRRTTRGSAAKPMFTAAELDVLRDGARGMLEARRAEYNAAAARLKEAKTLCSKLGCA